MRGFLLFLFCTHPAQVNNSHRILNLQSTEAAVSAAVADWGPAGQMPEGWLKATESTWSFVVGLYFVGGVWLCTDKTKKILFMVTLLIAIFFNFWHLSAPFVFWFSCNYSTCLALLGPARPGPPWFKNGKLFGLYSNLFGPIYYFYSFFFFSCWIQEKIIKSEGNEKNPEKGWKILGPMMNDNIYIYLLEITEALSK